MVMVEARTRTTVIVDARTRTVAAMVHGRALLTARVAHTSPDGIGSGDAETVPVVQMYGTPHVSADAMGVGETVSEPSATVGVDHDSAPGIGVAESDWLAWRATAGAPQLSADGIAAGETTSGTAVRASAPHASEVSIGVGDSVVVTTADGAEAQ
jgi:hypothetical protein